MKAASVIDCTMPPAAADLPDDLVEALAASLARAIVASIHGDQRANSNSAGEAPRVIDIGNKAAAS